MPSKSRALSLAPIEVTPLNRDRVDTGHESAYWLRFQNDRWLLYRHERLIGDFPLENAAMALAFLRQKQSEQPATAA